MFGIRTPPPKSDNSSPNLDEGALNVRRSIGEWEAANADPTPSMTCMTKQTGPATNPKARLTPSRDASAAAGLGPSTGTHSPQKLKNADRIAEARACLHKGKLHLNASRNTKTEIKSVVFEALERLYQLVKEAEAALKSKKPKDGTNATVGLEPVHMVTDSTFTVSEDPKLLSKIEEHGKLLLESNKKMEELRLAMERQQESLKSTATYASATATLNEKPLPKRNTLHSLVVTSKNESETGEEVLDRVRKAVDAKEGWIKVERVRKAKDRKIIMGFRTTEERNKIKDRFGKEGIDLVVEEVKNKDPLLILKNVLLVNTDEDVLRALRNQNRDVFRGLDSEEDRLGIKYRRRTRNPHTNHIVISTSPAIWRKVLDVGYLHIDLQRVKAEDQSPLVQCTRCLGYGHSKRFCKEPTDLCSHCGGPHLRTECADWLADIPPTCKNCTRDKLDQVCHNAFSYNCPTRQKRDELARLTIAYC